MQRWYIKETIEFSLADCQPIEFFLSIFCFIYVSRTGMLQFSYLRYSQWDLPDNFIPINNFSETLHP